MGRFERTKAHFTHNIFAHNIEIKRHWDKQMKRHFSIQKIFPVWIENIYFLTIIFIETYFENILKWR